MKLRDAISTAVRGTGLTETHRRVLVVDDDESIRELLAMTLRGYSLHVDEARNGREALELAEANPYSVILLDLLMPEVDGFVVLERLEQDTRHAGAVVLVITGADRSVLDELHSQRIQGIIKKPFDVEEVASVVAACTEIRGRANLGAMALATVIAGSQLWAAWLSGGW